MQNNKNRNQNYMDKILYNQKKFMYFSYNKKSHFVKYYIKSLKN